MDVIYIYQNISQAFIDDLATVLAFNYKVAKADTAVQNQSINNTQKYKLIITLVTTPKMLSKLMAELKSTVKPTPPVPEPPIRQQNRKANKPIQTTYASVPIPIPDSFLTTPPPDAQPITVTPIDFASSPLPEYAGCYAVVLDHVLSPSECATLLSLAEASVPSAEEGSGVLRNGPDDPWAPALVNVGGGFEVLEQGYRNGERIVWDRQEVVDRLWARCLSAGQGMRERFAELGEGEKGIAGSSVRGERDKWVFVRVNDRMRFLKYGKGGFFRRELPPFSFIRFIFLFFLFLLYSPIF
jgi:hypothetical protein